MAVVGGVGGEAAVLKLVGHLILGTVGNVTQIQTVGHR